VGIREEDWAVPQLLTSELVTNAVRFGQVPGCEEVCYITVTLWRLPGSLVIEVSDESPELPSMRTPNTDREGGRGLALVAGLSLEWGCYAGAAGWKTVYCVTACPAGRDSPARTEARKPE
jgi:anti-sigma regulatory factor (Ser/Thr protein kinase)